MKILIANKFFYPRGGDCISAINLHDLLKSEGNEVAIFAMNYPENINTEWDKYFAPEVSFSIGRIKGKLNAVKRIFGGAGVKKPFIKLLDDFQPDVLHLHNIHSYLSPVLAKIAYKRGVKVVWTLHDYKLLCPRYDCLRNDKENCEYCFNNKKYVLKYRCMKNSYFSSLLVYLEALIWNRNKLEKYVQTFICPSVFIKNKMLDGHFNEKKLKKMTNFIDVKKTYRDSYEKDDYFCYVGRLSNEKGVETLIESAKQLPYRLKILGDGVLKEKLKQESEGHDNIEFLGHRPWSEIKEIVAKARFLVIPSEWYENNPFSVIESLCLGTPILGANIGGLPELINSHHLNMAFKSKNAKDLKEKIGLMWNKELDEIDYENLSSASLAIFNEKKYYTEIVNVYTNEKNN